MIYTPCTVTFADNAGATWTGTIYAGQLNILGGVTLTPKLMTLQDQAAGPSGSPSGPGVNTLGLPVSRSDQ
jgi:hypothetical protein